MTQSKRQQVHALIAQAAVMPRGVVASMLNVRTVALSLLVDRALSA